MESGLNAGRHGFHPTLFAKALATFVIVMAPIYMLSALMFMWSANSVRKEQMESARMGILLYLGGLERELSISLGEVVNLVEDEDMKLLASAQGRYDDVAYYKAGISMRKRFTNIRESSSFITEAVAFIPSKRAMLSTVSGFTAMTDDYAAIREAVKKGAYPFCEYNGAIISAIASDAFLAGSDEGTFTLAVRFSKDKILRELARYENAEQKRRAALVSTGRGITAFADDRPEVTGALAALAGERAAGVEESGTETISAGGVNYIVSWAKSATLQTMLLFYTPEESFGSMLLNYRYWLAAMSLLIVACVFLYSVWIRRQIIAPLDKLTGAYRRLERGDFGVELKYARNDEFGFIYERSNETFRRLGTLIEQVYEQKIRAREAELKQLQYQINPHFLYNSIVIIGNLIKMTDYDVAARLARHLGNYYQYLTKAGDFVPLEREAAHARDYIEIQKIRFADRFSYEFGAPPELWANFIVPRLILQPIIENAFKYGLGDTVSGGMLRVGMTAEDAALTLTVEDNGNIPDETLSALGQAAHEGGEAGMGLVNVHRRVQIRFGQGSGLSFRRSALGGLAVDIRIEKEDGSDAQSAGC